MKTEILTQKEKINNLEEDLAKRTETFAALEDNIKSLTADKDRYESQLASVRQVRLLTAHDVKFFRAFVDCIAKIA